MAVLVSPSRAVAGIHPLGLLEHVVVGGEAADRQVRVAASREWVLAPPTHQTADAAAVHTHGVAITHDRPQQHPLQSVSGTTPHLTQWRTQWLRLNLQYK